MDAAERASKAQPQEPSNPTASSSNQAMPAPTLDTLEEEELASRLPLPSPLLHPNTYRDSFRCRALPRYSLPTLTRIVQDAATPPRPGS